MHEPQQLCTVITDTADLLVRHVLHRDYETRSKLVLKSVGTHRYAADSNTEVLCCAYAVDDEPVQLWIPGDPVPRGVHRGRQQSQLARCRPRRSFRNWRSSTTLWRRSSAGRKFRSNVIVCTMAMALAVGLPARLSSAADALELANRKDAAGERLMHQMSKPRRPRQGEDLRSNLLV